MSASSKPDLDLTISRIIRAPRSAIWRAWTDPRRFERWWVPAPGLCRVVEMELEPGGAFSTLYSEDGQTFGPHLDACFLAVEAEARIVFTNALKGGWRPVDKLFMPALTAIITMRDHADGTEYGATVLHKNDADREKHVAMGFYDGWGTVFGQLAEMVEQALV